MGRGIWGLHTVIKEFLSDKPLNHLAMLVALALVTISQFFPHFDDATTGLATFGENYSMDVFLWFGRSGSGWFLHPQAYVILVVLAFAFLRSDIYEHRLMQKFGWWLAALLILICTIPGAPLRAEGAGMGGIAFLTALGAAILHQVARLRTKVVPKT